MRNSHPYPPISAYVVLVLIVSSALWLTGCNYRRAAKEGPADSSVDSVSCTGTAMEPTAGPGFVNTGSPTSVSPGVAQAKPDVKPWTDLTPGEELWIIETAAERPRVPGGEYYPTRGELRVTRPGKQEEVALPLKHTDVRAQVSAFLAMVHVTQQYENPYAEKIEAVYVFPLPDNAAVTDFVMTIGTRHIRGVIRERKEAQRIYEEAKSRGYVASLLTQERPNVFTQKVANIEPGKQIDVQITYFSPLRYEEGVYEFVFPMVVGPRFNPPGSTQGVGAVGMGQRGASGQKTEVEYLRPHQRSGHDIRVSVDVEAGVPIEQIVSPTHAIALQRHGPSHVTASLSRLDSVPNKDFVLRYKVAGRKLQTALLTHRSENGNTFALVLQPPADLAELPRVPREMVFVLDCSGSMNGWPLAKARETMRRCLENLDENDTFQIIRFSDNASSLGRKPIPATPANVRRGLRYLESLQSEGGTMMIEGIKAALDLPRDGERMRIVSFLTDGYIGNETEIFQAIQQRIGSTRIFSFGVGSSVNRYLLEGMARLGRGAVAFITLEETPTAAVNKFYERASRPALTDIEIDWGEMEVADVYPRRVPDLFVGRPLLIAGRFEGNGSAKIRVRGRAGREVFTDVVRADLDDPGTQHEGIAKVWARWKIADLSDRELRSASQSLRREILVLSLTHRLLCQYSAFLAVDSLQRTAGDHGVSVNVPVPVPAGVRYDTTVKE